MTGNWIRPPRAERRSHWRFHVGLVAIIVLFVAVMVAVNALGEQLPSSTSVGPTPCDVTIAGQCARHLTTTTTVQRTTSTTKPPTYGPDNPADYLLIIDGQVTRIPKTIETTAVITWLLRKGI